MNFVDYIHQNPVKRKLVEKASRWYYSSYNYWHERQNVPLDIDLKDFPR